MRVAVVTFPGSHGAEDAVYVYRDLLGQDAYTVWHQEESLKKPDVVIIPGGASFADYLRPGALSVASPILGPVVKFARDGGPILGIGNGFQILCEAKILPGILLQNPSLHFLNRDTHVLVCNNETPFTKTYEEEDIIVLPIACFFGRYYADKRTMKDLEENGQVVLRYCDREGDVDYEEPFNGCLNGVAAVTSRHYNVLGMMCHPERVSDPLLGSEVGRKMLECVLSK